MPRQRQSADETVAKPRKVNMLTAQGTPVADAIHHIGVTAVTHDHWQKEYGGLKSDQVWPIKDLKQKNARQRRSVFGFTLDKLMPRENLEFLKTQGLTASELLQAAILSRCQSLWLASSP